MHLETRHPLDSKPSLSFFIDRLVYWHDVPAYEALVAAVEDGGTICNSVYRADVVLVDAATADLSTLSRVGGAIVSYKYIEHCLAVGKRASILPFIVETPVQLNRPQLPEVPLWRQDDTQRQVINKAQNIANDDTRASERSKLQPISHAEDVKHSELVASIVAGFGDDPPIPMFETQPGKETDLTAGAAFEWWVAFVRWVAVVQPNMKPRDMSKAVALIIPGVKQPDAFFQMYCDTAHPQLRGFELLLAMRTTSKIARQENLVPWEAEDVHDAITRVARRSNPAQSSLSEAQKCRDAVEDSIQEKISRPLQKRTNSKEPRPPATHHLRHNISLARNEETKRWMEKWYRWKLTRLKGRPRPSKESLSEEIAKKTNGALKRSSFRHYWERNKETFEQIEAEVLARRQRKKGGTTLDNPLTDSDNDSDVPLAELTRRQTFTLAASPEL